VLDSFVDTLFQRLADVCAASRQAFLQHIGMSQPRIHLLSVLARVGEISHAALQEHLGLDGATITRLVKQFETEGVVRRRLDPQNNRYTLVSLTPSGHQVVAELQTAHRAFQRRLLDGISPADQQAMLAGLERLQTNIRVMHESDHQAE
jgi:DNA-binding MarR family transcriptional regulator